LSKFVTDPLSGGLQGRGVIRNMSHYLDLDRLRQRVGERPRTKVAQVRQAWPDIKQLQAAGHSLKDIWTWLDESGLEIGYANLSHCLRQLRRRDLAAQSHRQDLPGGPTLAPTDSDGEEQPHQRQPGGQSQGSRLTADPLRNLRVQRSRKKTFEYDPFPKEGLTQ